MEHLQYSNNLAIAPFADKGLAPVEYIGAGAYGFVLKVSDKRNNNSALKIVPVIVRPHEDKADGIIRERKFYQYLEKAEKGVKMPNLAIATTWWSIENVEKSAYLKWNKTLRRQLNVAALDLPSRLVKEMPGEFKLCVNFLQMTYYASGNLRTWLERNSNECRESYSLRIQLFCDILSAVAFLHERGLMHRDVCPNNIFLAKDNHRLYAVLGDFDTIVSCGEQAQWPLTKTRETCTRVMGTDPYAAPEIDGGDYGKECDLFSLGVIALNLFFNIVDYDGLRQAVYKIRKMDSCPPCIIVDKTRLWLDILQAQLSDIPQRRMNSCELLETIKENHQSLNFETVASVDSMPVSPETPPTATLQNPGKMSPELSLVKQLVLFCVKLPSPCCAEGRKMCSRREVKRLVIFFNVLAFVAGVVLLGGCVAAYVSMSVSMYFVKYLSEDVSNSVPSFQSWNNVLIGGMFLGGIIFLMGFLGCCGAWKEVKWMLTIFSIVMMIIVATQVAVAVLVYVDKDKVHDQLNNMLQKAGTDAKPNSEECQMFHDLANNNVCCGTTTLDKTQCPLTCATVTETCPDAIYHVLVIMSEVAGACLIGMLFIELLSVTFSILLCRSVDKQYRDKRRYPIPLPSISL